jgi:hypothetical protein
MNNKVKLLSVFFFFLCLLTICATYYRMFHLHDYMIILDIPCEPNIENCFAVEEEAGITYFKIIEFYAPYGNKCDMGQIECRSSVCSNSEASCHFINCDSDTEFKDKFEMCSNDR